MGKAKLTNREGGVRRNDFAKGDGTKTARPANGPITIGGWRGAGGAFSDTFQGAIDEVMIWKVAFTEEEIQSIMQGPGADFLGVEPHKKLATKWGSIKQSP